MEILSYATTLMKLKDIMLSKIGQPQRENNAYNTQILGMKVVV
jgi:hypothetical protein